LNQLRHDCYVTKQQAESLVSKQQFRVKHISTELNTDKISCKIELQPLNSFIILYFRTIQVSKYQIDQITISLTVGWQKVFWILVSYHHHHCLFFVSLEFY